MTSQGRPGKKNHTFPEFYGVYLLQSEPKPRSFYIGSTPDPVRRLRQHNGELTAGAYKTKRDGFRPWNMILIVHGFPSKIAALQFEHALQHPYQTRHIREEKRITKSKGSGNSVHHRMGNIRLLLNSNFFTKMNLKVQLFDNKVYHDWCSNKFGIKLLDSVQIDQKFSDVKEFKKEIIEKKDEYFEKSKEVISFGSHTCSICNVEVNYTSSIKFPRIAICYYPDCNKLVHLTCLGRSFLEDATSENNDTNSQTYTVSSQQFVKANSRGTIDFSKMSQAARNLVKNDLNNEIFDSEPLIPQKGKCPSCNKVLIWTVLVKNSVKLRNYAYKEEIQDETDEQLSGSERDDSEVPNNES